MPLARNWILIWHVMTSHRSALSRSWKAQKRSYFIHLCLEICNLWHFPLWHHNKIILNGILWLPGGQTHLKSGKEVLFMHVSPDRCVFKHFLVFSIMTSLMTSSQNYSKWQTMTSRRSFTLEKCQRGNIYAFLSRNMRF